MKKYVNKIKKIFKKNKNKLFITDALSEKEFTYGDIEELSLKLVSIMSKEGIEKNDKVAIILPNCIEFVILYFACMQIGAIPVPINTMLHHKEIKVIVESSDAKVLFISQEILDSFKEGIMGPEKIFGIKPSLEKNFKNTFLEKIKKQKTYKIESFQNITDEDIIVIIYTSGTTSRPKGVKTSYRNLLRNGLEFLKLLNLNNESRFHLILALSYMGGFYNLLLIPFLAEGSFVLDEVFNTKAIFNFWNKVRTYSINTLWIIPSILSVLLALDKSEDGINYCKAGNIRVALIGTAPLPLSLKKRFEERYSLTLYENYGTSEIHFMTTNSPNFSLNRGVGKVVPGFKISFIDKEGNKHVNRNSGEIVIEPEFAFQGYYKNNEETKKVFKRGQFYTGDIGYLDEEGYLHITDRKKDLIIRGGVNISPREIEEIIMKIKSVKEVAVVGIKNKLIGEKIVAFVKTSSLVTEDFLKDYCQNHLALFKIPEKFIFVKEFPRSVTGKIKKNKLKDMIK